MYPEYGICSSRVWFYAPMPCSGNTNVGLHAGGGCWGVKIIPEVAASEVPAVGVKLVCASGGGYLTEADGIFPSGNVAFPSGEAFAASGDMALASGEAFAASGQRTGVNCMTTASRRHKAASEAAPPGPTIRNSLIINGFRAKRNSSRFKRNFVWSGRNFVWDGRNSVCSGRNFVCSGRNSVRCERNSVCFRGNSFCLGRNLVCSGSHAVRAERNSFCCGRRAGCSGTNSFCLRRNAVCAGCRRALASGTRRGWPNQSTEAGCFYAV